MAKEKKDERVPLTKEEVVARKAEMTKWHKDQIPFLKTQFEYENLVTKVQQAITDRLEAEYKWVQLKAAMMEPQGSQPNSESNENTAETAEMVQHEEGTPKHQPIRRTLKTE